MNEGTQAERHAGQVLDSHSPELRLTPHSTPSALTALFPDLSQSLYHTSSVCTHYPLPERPGPHPSHDPYPPQIPLFKTVVVTLTEDRGLVMKNKDSKFFSYYHPPAYIFWTV